MGQAHWAWLGPGASAMGPDPGTDSPGLGSEPWGPAATDPFQGGRTPQALAQFGLGVALGFRSQDSGPGPVPRSQGAGAGPGPWDPGSGPMRTQGPGPGPWVQAQGPVQGICIMIVYIHILYSM